MSNIYVQEPDTSGKVVLTTSHGNHKIIDVEFGFKSLKKFCLHYVKIAKIKMRIHVFYNF